MKNQQEIWGLRLELAGLIIVFFTTVWQVLLTDWFDEQKKEWQFYIQEEVNMAVLASQMDIASMISTEDKSREQSLWLDIYNRNGGAINKALQERDKRRTFFEKGQGYYFQSIKSSLLMLGSILLAFGKWLAIRGSRSKAK
jgi:hypothetical protein